MVKSIVYYGSSIWSNLERKDISGFVGRGGIDHRPSLSSQLRLSRILDDTAGSIVPLQHTHTQRNKKSTVVVKNAIIDQEMRLALLCQRDL